MTRRKTSSRRPFDHQRPDRRIASLAALVGANAVSMTGNALARVAIPWLVIEAGGSPAQTGLAVGLEVLPVVVGGLFGGVVADRMGHRLTSVIADLASGATIVLIPLLSAAAMLPLELLMVLIFAGALLDAPGTAARQALLPDLAARSGVSLERAEGADATAQRTSILVGPILAGAFIPVLGVATVLAINAGSFLASAAIVGFLVPSPATQNQDVPKPLWRDSFTEGVSALGTDRVLRTLLVAPTLLAIFISPVFFVALPLHLNQAGNALGLGLAFSVYGSGAVLGSVAYGAFGRHGQRRTWYLVCAAGMTAGVGIIAALPPLPTVLAAAALVGVSYGPIGPLTAVVVANRVAPALRGRVFGVFNAARNLATSLALLLGGVALSGVSIGIGVTTAAFGCAVITILQTRSHALHYLNPTTDREEEPMEQPRTELDRRYSEPEASATDWADTRAILEKAELSWISTVRADGRPHVTPLVAVWLDGAAYFTTGPDEQKARNLSHNPHVVLTTGSAEWRHGTDVTVEGEARQVTDADILKQLTEAWKAKWDGRWRFQANEGGLSHENGGGALVFQVTPTKVLAFGKGGFKHTRHLFENRPNTTAS